MRSSVSLWFPANASEDVQPAGNTATLLYQTGNIAYYIQHAWHF